MAARKLTPKQLHFARCVASGMTQSDGYREAFNPKDSTTAASIHTLASRLISDVEVRSRVDALVKARERAVQLSVVTDREKVTSHLRKWMDGLEETDSNRLRSAELKAWMITMTGQKICTEGVYLGEIQRISTWEGTPPVRLAVTNLYT